MGAGVLEPCRRLLIGLNKCQRQLWMGRPELGVDGDSLVVVIFHKLLELFNVAYRLQVLLHMGQGGEVICKRWIEP